MLRDFEVFYLTLMHVRVNIRFKHWSASRERRWKRGNVINWQTAKLPSLAVVFTAIRSNRKPLYNKGSSRWGPAAPRQRKSPRLWTIWLVCFEWCWPRRQLPYCDCPTQRWDVWPCDSSGQDLDAIHTRYMKMVFWDPQQKASRHQMLDRCTCTPDRPLLLHGWPITTMFCEGIIIAKLSTCDSGICRCKEVTHQ